MLKVSKGTTSMIKLRSLNEIKKAEKEKQTLLMNEFSAKEYPNDSNKIEMVQNYWISDYEWFILTGEISALR